MIVYFSCLNSHTEMCCNDELCIHSCVPCLSIRYWFSKQESFLNLGHQNSCLRRNTGYSVLWCIVHHPWNSRKMKGSDGIASLRKHLSMQMQFTFRYLYIPVVPYIPYTVLLSERMKCHVHKDKGSPVSVHQVIKASTAQIGQWSSSKAKLAGPLASTSIYLRA